MNEFFQKLYYLLRHLGENGAWQQMIDFIGTPSLYAVLFGIIFLETGVVIFPFLPGDSLLFAVGAVVARGVGINFWGVFVLLTIAAIVGDAVNYLIGYKVGPAVFNRSESTGPKRFTDRLLNRKHLAQAQAFYDKHGGKTIILARFVPVIRTFAPFVAGVGKMSYLRFGLFNVVGAVLWVFICLMAGRLFGSVEFVKKNFELVIVMIVLISVVPVAIELIRARRADKKGGDVLLEATTLGERPE